AGEDARLYDTVTAVSELARELKIAIPVGKDSLSMNTIWQDGNENRQVYAPMSVNITAFAPVADIRKTLTPQLQAGSDTCLLLVDLGAGQNRLGGSCLAQVYKQFGDVPPDLDDPALLSGFFQAIQLLNEAGLILAYHDRSDGGLFVTLCEMAFASHQGLDIALAPDDKDMLAQLFSEEPGAVIQVARQHLDSILDTFNNAGLTDKHIRVIGEPVDHKQITISHDSKVIYTGDIRALHGLWSSTSNAIQSLRDNPDCAREELETILDMDDPGLFLSAPFEMPTPNAPYIQTGAKPRIAILREQGVNGQVEMAAAFTRAGFDCTDVHTNDLINNDQSLQDFQGMVACGGFSYGDVLGAGGGWAKSILFNPALRDSFQRFFERNDSFGLGVCNGCQMFSQLRDLIPGAGHWPDFLQNRSEQFEARLVMTEILESPSILMRGMAGAFIPVAVAHGEGRVQFRPGQDSTTSHPVMRFTNNHGKATEHYPANPNGSPQGLTGFCNTDGRFTIMMPHPERVFLTRQLSWAPPDWQHEESPWMQLFTNARSWLG
ncbi:MAG: phosphoribosylformylglycinamidine synthase, partial [Gammaproteobacteria bacterium]